MPDCGSNSCLYAKEKTGQRTNHWCKCDSCPDCGRMIRPKHGLSKHYDWCEKPDWVGAQHLIQVKDMTKVENEDTHNDER
jgi:hypothetical protein